MHEPAPHQPPKLPVLEYAPSPYAPLVRVGERFLKLLRDMMRDSGRRWRDILIVILLLILSFVGLMLLLVYSQRPYKVADIPGPASSGRTYELWYDRTGDLTLRTWGNPSITYRDYYGSVEVVSSKWLADDHLLLTMKDGGTVEIRVRFDVSYGRNMPATTAATSN